MDLDRLTQSPAQISQPHDSPARTFISIIIVIALIVGWIALCFVWSTRSPVSDGNSFGRILMVAGGACLFAIAVLHSIVGKAIFDNNPKRLVKLYCLALVGALMFWSIAVFTASIPTYASKIVLMDMETGTTRVVDSNQQEGFVLKAPLETVVKVE